MVLKLRTIQEASGLHSNGIIFDLMRKQVIRFEPHGHMTLNKEQTTKIMNSLFQHFYLLYQ